VSAYDAIARPNSLSLPQRRALGVGLFLSLMSLSALFQIPMPPDGVPQTLQSLVAILAALSLGPRFGALSMALYVLIGALGAPIYARGDAGLAVLIGQTGGFLVGFIAAQPVVSVLVRRRDGRARGWLGLVLAVVLGHAVIFAFGVPWLAYVRGFSMPRALEGACYPFLPGMAIKAALAVWIGRLVVPWSIRRVW